ncbi:WD40 repeat-like protein [Linderina pennispora]|uniref:WD40 repeat-like protein n=1 Tax=Linderina pennispora TaxID=61395 RepID=A0A1Y1W1Z8_9FUNG|nr:WD40 repeat-like protein [Linderina pennispora]ORX67144.1 WD40 repeat-like protein [Linderina pennispora]
MEKEFSIPVNHDDFIHDVAYNFYGTRLATCGSDRSIKIWDWNKQTGLWVLNESISAHDSSVLKVSWAHPEFGQVLASCSLDRTVKIWIEQDAAVKGSTGRWKLAATLVESTAAIHSIAFAPDSDGTVRFYSPTEAVSLRNWTATDSDGPLCVSWCKSRFSAPNMIVVAGSKGNRVRVFQLIAMRCVEVLEIDKYDAHVLDVDWAPSMGRSFHLIATACADGHIRIYKFCALEDSLFVHEDSDLDHDDDDDDDDVTGEESSDNESLASIPEESKDKSQAKPVDKTPAPRAELVADLAAEPTAPVRHVRWNSTGTLLVSSGDDGVTRVWRMNINGDWRESAVVSAEKSSAAAE